MKQRLLSVLAVLLLVLMVQGTLNINNGRSIPVVIWEVLMNNDLVCRPAWAVQAHADLKRHEGFRPYAYPDPESKLGKAHGRKFGYKPADEVLKSIGANEADGRPWTIGYGFARGVKLTDHITEEEASERLWPEIFEHAAELDSIVPNWGDMPLHVQSVLVNLVFNMGANSLKGFKNTLPMFIKGQYEAAGRALRNSLWYKQVGNRAVELTQRLINGSIPDSYKATN